MTVGILFVFKRASSREHLITVNILDAHVTQFIECIIGVDGLI
jgi:hypothetical protein